MNKKLISLATMLGLVLSVGCGSEEITYEVTGTVTYFGKPLTQGIVAFTPEKGRPLTPARIGKDGSYRLDAPVGTYRVAVIAMPDIPSRKQGQHLEEAPVSARSLIPERYGNITTSGLTATVEAGKTDPHDFLLR